MANQAPNVQTPSRAATVFVGCKLPHGLVLHLGAKKKGNFKSHTLKGRYAGNAVAGCGITEIPADFYTEWARVNAQMSFIRNSAVFSHASREGCADMARNFKGLKTGLERLDPFKLPTKLEMDKDERKALLKQIAANPDRAREEEANADA